MPVTGRRLLTLRRHASRSRPVPLPTRSRRTAHNPAWPDAPAQWIAGARPRTLPAAVAPVLAGTAIAVWERRGGLVEGAARAGRRRCCCRSASTTPTTTPTASAAPTTTGSARCGSSAAGSPAPGGQGGRVRGARGRRAGRPGARRDDRVVAGRRRAALHPRRLVLHRRQAALRLPRPRRGDGLRLLRAGRGARHDVRPDRDLRAPRAVRRRSGSAPSPARSWSPTTCATSPPTRLAGKRTLAVVLGDERTRHLYGLLVGVAVVALVGVALTTTWWALLALAAAPRRPSARSRLVLRRQGHRARPGPGAAADRRRRAALRRRHPRRHRGQRGASPRSEHADATPVPHWTTCGS